MSTITVLVALSAFLVSVYANQHALADSFELGLEAPEGRSTKYHLVKRKSNQLSGRNWRSISHPTPEEETPYLKPNHQDTSLKRVHDYNLHADLDPEEVARVERELREVIKELEQINKRNVGFGPTSHSHSYGPSHVEHKSAAIHHLIEAHKRASHAHEAGVLSASHAAELLDCHKKVAAAFGVEHLVHPHGPARSSAALNLAGVRPLGRAQHHAAGLAHPHHNYQ